MRTLGFILILILGQLIASPAAAQANPVTGAKAQKCFYTAKDELEKMLNDEAPLDYARAVFLMENAYWEDQLDFERYKVILDMHTSRIKALYQSQSRTVKREDFTSTIYQSAEEQYKKRLDVLANWAIYTYLTDTIDFTLNEAIALRHFPYQYSYEDPLATSKWENSQVIHLLDEQRGNCYAFVSLYKIFAERLNAPAEITTAPGHVFIRHRDEYGILYNVELASRAFPGSGTIQTLTYTTEGAVKSGVTMRSLNTKQSVALCFVYLAKAYQHKFNIKDDEFMMACANAALHYDPLSTNAVLLKAELLQEQILNSGAIVAKPTPEYEALIVELYETGYREMPAEMKALIFSRIRRQQSGGQLLVDHSPETYRKGEPFITLSQGLYEEVQHPKAFEKYSRTIFDTKKKKIVGFEKKDSLYEYQYDPVVFALSVDPLTSKYSSFSPYNFVNNCPIYFIDYQGMEPIEPAVTDLQSLLKVIREHGIDSFDEMASFYGQSPLETPPASNSAIEGKGASKRYIYTKRAGWIDLKHFFEAADLAEDMGATFTVKKGENVELDQLKKNDGSAYDYEDLQSNLQGAIFGEDAKNLQQGELFYQAITLRFTELGATDPKEAPNYKKLKPTYHTETGESLMDYTPIYAPEYSKLPDRLKKSGFDKTQEQKRAAQKEKYQDEQRSIDWDARNPK